MPVYVASRKMGLQPPLYHFEIRISELVKVDGTYQGIGCLHVRKVILEEETFLEQRVGLYHAPLRWSRWWLVKMHVFPMKERISH